VSPEVLKNDLLLHEAVIKNDVEAVEAILKEPVDVNCRNNVRLFLLPILHCIFLR